MADRLKPSCALVILLALCAAPVYAEELSDPTRPPAIIAAPVSAGIETGDGPPAGLQSIIISKNRRAAIIDGETVELGKKHGDARLVEVNEGNVVLQGVQGRQVLTLFPGVKMTQRESKVKPQSPVSKVRTGKRTGKPAAQDKKLLSGHPQEEK